uniref:Uncharacterized protein n=1 Tax=Romanomermis culicivorax TaxID=13658 RepID=A0A915IVF0_ROMCU
MWTGSVASVSQVCSHSAEVAAASTGGSGVARTGAVRMLGRATSVVVGAASMVGAHLYCLRLRDDRGNGMFDEMGCSG